jgi:hypothetical protein
MPGNLYDHPLIEELLKLPLPLGFLALDQALSTSGLIENAMAINRKDRPRESQQRSPTMCLSVQALAPSYFGNAITSRAKECGNEAETSENNGSDCGNHNGMTLTCA